MVGCQKYTDDQINFILDRHFRGIPHTQIKDEFLEHFNFPSYNIKRVQYVVEHYGRNPKYGLNEPDHDQTSRLVRDFLNFQPPRTTQSTDLYGVIDPALTTHQPTDSRAAYTTGNIGLPPQHHGLAPLGSGVQGLQDNNDWDGMHYPPGSTGYYKAPSFDTATSYTGGPTAPRDPLALLNTEMPKLPELPATPHIQQPPFAPPKHRGDITSSPSYSLTAAVDDTCLLTSAPGQPYGYHTPASDFHYGTVGSSVPGPQIPTLAPGTPSSSQRPAAKRPRVSASDERTWTPANKRPRISASISPSPSPAGASTAAAAAGTPRWAPAFPRATPVAGDEWTDAKREDFAGTVELPSLPPPAETGTSRLPHYDHQILRSIEEDPEQAAPSTPRFYDPNNKSPPPPAPGNDEAGHGAASGEGQWRFSSLSEPPGTPSQVLDEWRAQASPREH
ncbi:hypothetical protein DL769_007219 [Monosporascus sp. CRB-8-3]|nr:hypothetical protein DL769_007219 [Monosporascus sp. CRB-8-3]